MTLEKLIIIVLLSTLIALVSITTTYNIGYKNGQENQYNDTRGYIYIPCGQKLHLDNLDGAIVKNITFDTEDWCNQPIVVVGKQTKNSQFYFTK